MSGAVRLGRAERAPLPFLQGGAARSLVARRWHRRRVGGPVTDSDSRPSGSADGVLVDERPLPLVIATMLREEGSTGVQTHVRQLRQYLEERGETSTVLTPFSWGRPADRTDLRRTPRAGPVQPASQRRLVPALARGVPPPRAAPLPRRNRRLRRLRPGSRWPRVRRCARGKGRTSAWSWPCTSASPRPTSGQTRSRSGGTAPCSGRSGGTEREVIPRVDGLMYVSNGRGMRSWMVP